MSHYRSPSRSFLFLRSLNRLLSSLDSAFIAVANTYIASDVSLYITHSPTGTSSRPSAITMSAKRAGRWISVRAQRRQGGAGRYKFRDTRYKYSRFRICGLS